MRPGGKGLRPLNVIPAKAGISCRKLLALLGEIPAFAGMTIVETGVRRP